MAARSPAVTARKRLPGPERRREIIDNALDLFSRQGYSATSIDQLATAVGVTAPVLYRHFPSKEKLFLAVLADQVQRLAAAIGSAEDPGSAPLEQRLVATAEAIIDFASDRPAAWQLLRRTPPMAPAIAAAYREIRVGMRRRTAKATERDPDFSAPTGVSRRAAAEFFGELQWTAFEALGDRAAAGRKPNGQALVQIFMDFIWVGLQQFREGVRWQGFTRR